uniref:beta-N-acetylhexosaminidase n=1 Tax=Trichobilharzia regenti TaxID=157069 RepID=A0AA85J7L8_TRIRE|nr:unnamed protein product [Trichobilharzia regenti]
MENFLDAMALVKMNVFHWHITDDSSFPYQSSTYPQLSQKGAYHPIKLVYGDGIVGQLLNYARLRGIRVLVEFDTPSHTRSWEKGHPGLRTKCYTEGSPNGETGPFDPTNQTTMGFLTSFFNEITSKFRERFIHLGGGDISFECWQSNPDIVNFMKTKGFGEDYGKLESYYFEELIKAIQSVQQKKGPITPVVWEDTFHNGYRPKDQNPVFQVWDESNRQERVRNITSAGYRVILSSCFLISAKNYVGHWYSYYECDPRDFSGSDDEKQLVIGGEAVLVGDFVDETILFTRSWPDGAVTAERLWSQGDFNITKFIPRLNELRCRMLE